MSDPIVYGFPRSTYVNIVRLILTYKDVAYSFHDLEPVMGKPDHLSLHPFNRVPILKHGDFTVYETSAIASYVDQAFPGPRLTPQDVRLRARMNQWISAVNSYYYPYMIYHVSHGQDYLLGPELTLADFFMLPSTFAFSLTEDGRAMYPKFPAFCRWRERMENLPTTKKLRSTLPPREPIWHAREWANSHRPKY